jgi:hypothetical protein
VVLDTARTVRAPAVEFAALTQADPNHTLVVAAPSTGAVVEIDSARHVRKGDALAHIHQESAGSAAPLTIRAPLDGIWWPRWQAGQVVSKGDTIGLIQEHGFGLAVGSVPDIEAGAIHPGDPATVRVEGAGREIRVGRVDWIRRQAYSVEVAADFRELEASMDRPRSARVTVTPAGPGDSVAAVPASAVVRLPPGSAVFVPVAAGVYEVRWIVAMSRRDRIVSVREGIAAGTPVASRYIVLLAQAARDSLARRQEARK